jgi:hypothetical protein
MAVIAFFFSATPLPVAASVVEHTFVVRMTPFYRFDLTLFLNTIRI